MSEAYFRDVLDALLGFLPGELADVEYRVYSRGLKVWYGDDTKEHYEVQYVGRYADATGRERKGTALEIGFHAEHRDPKRNEAVLDQLARSAKTWQRKLGKAAQADYFVGDRSKTWRRVSEFWTGSEIDEPDTAIEAADRLAAYICALEPPRTRRPVAKRVKSA